MQRLRLERAAYKLAITDESIVQIGLLFDYEVGDGEIGPAEHHVAGLGEQHLDVAVISDIAGVLGSHREHLRLR